MAKTKTFWGGLAAIATGIGFIVTGNIAEGAVIIVNGVLSIFIRDGIRKAMK